MFRVRIQAGLMMEDGPIECNKERRELLADRQHDRLAGRKNVLPGS